MSVMNTGGIFDGFDFEAQGIDSDIYGSMNQPMNPLDAGSVMGLDAPFGTPDDWGSGGGNEWGSANPDDWNMGQYTPGGGGDGGGTPFDFAQGGGDWITKLLNKIPGVGSGNIPLAMLIPALTAAMNQFKDSDRYMDYGREAAGMASPISNDERQNSLRRYRSIEDDPNGYLNNSPLYQAALRQGLNSVERSQAAKGNIGSGEMLMALQDVGQDTATKFVDRDLQRIRQDAGFQFDPANAASMFMSGVRGSIDSRNSALGSLMFPLGMMAMQNREGGGGTTINNNISNGGQSGGKSSLLDTISKLPPGSLPPELFNTLGRVPGGIRGLMNPDPAVTNYLRQQGIVFDDKTGELTYRDPMTGQTTVFGDSVSGRDDMSDSSWEDDPLAPYYGGGDDQLDLTQMDPSELDIQFDEIEDWWAELGFDEGP
jgi:hypothetical protein